MILNQFHFVYFLLNSQFTPKETCKNYWSEFRHWYERILIYSNVIRMSEFKLLFLSWGFQPHNHILKSLKSLQYNIRINWMAELKLNVLFNKVRQFHHIIFPRHARRGDSQTYWDGYFCQTWQRFTTTSCLKWICIYDASANKHLHTMRFIPFISTDQNNEKYLLNSIDYSYSTEWVTFGTNGSQMNLLKCSYCY